MPKWRRFEKLIRNIAKTDQMVQFSSEWVAEHMEVSQREATSYVQAYLAEMRHPYSRAKYMVHRVGRTRNALWIVGAWHTNADLMKDQFFDDAMCKVRRAYYPDLNHLARTNPAIWRECEDHRERIEEAMEALRIACNGIYV